MRSLIMTKQLCEQMKTAGATQEISMSSADELSLAVYGDATTLNYKFEVSLDGSHWMPIEGYCISSGSDFVTSCNMNNVILSFDVSPVNRFRVVITEVSGGSVCMYANAYSIS